MSKNYNKINETILTEQAKFNTPMQASHSLGSVLKKTKSYSLSCRLFHKNSRTAYLKKRKTITLTFLKLFTNSLLTLQ